MFHFDWLYGVAVFDILLCIIKCSIPCGRASPARPASNTKNSDYKVIQPHHDAKHRYSYRNKWRRMPERIEIILWERVVRVDRDGPTMYSQNDKLVGCTRRSGVRSLSQIRGRTTGKTRANMAAFARPVAHVHNAALGRPEARRQSRQGTII